MILVYLSLRSYCPETVSIKGNRGVPLQAGAWLSFISGIAVMRIEIRVVTRV